MRCLDLFSGIGGFPLAASWVWGQDHEPVAFCEIDPFCQKVLKKHWPDVPCHDDIKTLKGDKFGTIELISGGFPCQPYSVAGKRLGKEDDRALWPEMLRVIKEAKPRWIIGENVAGFINMGLDDCLSDLENEGYETTAFIIPACAVNAPHRRDRVWIIANSGLCSDRTNRGKIREKKNGIQKIDRAEMGSGMPNGTTCYAPNPSNPRIEGMRRKRENPIFQNSIIADSNKLNGRPGAGRENRPEINNDCEYTADSGSKRFQESERSREPYGSTSKPIKAWSETWIEVAARLCRVDARLSNRVDRLKSLGNAIVPQVVVPIMQAIKDIDEFIKGTLENTRKQTSREDFLTAEAGLKAERL